MSDALNGGSMNRLTVITPVFNDWPSLAILLRALEDEFDGRGYALDVVAVDDCSIGGVPDHIEVRGVIDRVDIVQLGLNVGHQRAIAVGLVHVASRDNDGFVAVMDSDGEDQPRELVRLVALALEQPDRAIVAQRRKRSESVIFRLFYAIYKRLFALFTGKRISFGNFSVLPQRHVRQIVHNANIWNNFAATLIQARLPISYVPTVRGRRYAGQSRMSFINLVTHGLGAISVFSEAVFVRILIMSTAMLVLSIVAALAVLGVRLSSSLAVPGWTTNVLGFALLLSFQAVMLPVTVAFLLLNNRASIQELPKDHAHKLMEWVRTVHAFAAKFDEAD